MSKIKFINNVASQITSPVGLTDTIIYLSDVSRLEVPAPDEVLIGTLDSITSGNTLPEIVHITGINYLNRSVSVVRAQDNTAAQTWAVGDTFQCRVTDEILSEFVQRSRDYMVGPLVFADSLDPVTPHIRIEQQLLDAIGSGAAIRFARTSETPDESVPASIQLLQQLQVTAKQDINLRGTRITFDDVSNAPNGSGLASLHEGELVTVNEVNTITSLLSSSNTTSQFIPSDTSTVLHSVVVASGERHASLKFRIVGLVPNPDLITVEVRVGGDLSYTESYSVEGAITIDKMVNLGDLGADTTIDVRVADALGSTITQVDMEVLRNRLDAGNVFYDNSNTSSLYGDSVQDAIDAIHRGITAYEQFDRVYPVTAGQVEFPMALSNVDRVDVYLNGSYLTRELEYLFDEAAQLLTITLDSLRESDTLMVTHYIRTSSANSQYLNSTTLWHTFTGDMADKKSIRDILNGIKTRLDVLDGGDL
jgi:hypothetical protein